MTAIGNDYALEDLFARQVEVFGRPEDVLAAFTTSGQSDNVRRGLLAAKKFGLTSNAFLERGGGRCAGLGDIELMVAGTETARIQEGRKVLLHTMCEMVELDLAAAEQEGWGQHGLPRARHLTASGRSARVRMKKPPTTLRAWKPTCLPVTVSYQSVRGARLVFSLLKSRGLPFALATSLCAAMAWRQARVQSQV